MPQLVIEDLVLPVDMFSPGFSVELASISGSVHAGSSVGRSVGRVMNCFLVDMAIVCFQTLGLIVFPYSKCVEWAE